MTLEILTSSRLDTVLHGFFTRRGGASSGIYSGLNCGFGSSDQREVVAINRSRVASAMDVEADALVTIHQVHSPTAIIVDGQSPQSLPKGDALVTGTPGVALGILTADCQPILFHDADNAVIGAAHAGWKGALTGVLEDTLAAMERIGADRTTTVAVIGPTISQSSYEVGPEFRQVFVDADAGNRQYFQPGKDDRSQFDLVGYSLDRLRAAGIGEATSLDLCTYSEPDRFYSYRRSVHRGEADYGRLISVIRL